ncbi:putative nudix domain-containing protein [Rosellinia necatrix]|uniref:Putative nudix domain-containing protein n=1 Tax=Rosellinia necatrix TaxID=77044 RepID=A0A1W2TIZ7_ROSNE|nr:putative nudix domain-containing protein [Rosellinia necatrix]
MAATAPAKPRVGISNIIRNARGEVLVGKRKGSHGAGTWAFPGGHLEMGESFFTCAEREGLEETGLHIRGVKVVATTNDVFDAASKHYITIFVLCVLEGEGDAEPRTMEPNKCEGWHWMSWNQLREYCKHNDDEQSPEKCFLPLVNLVKDYPQLDLAGSL